jgi:hypothetical protein
VIDEKLSHSRLRVKNWSKFQHYKDRCPPWIKLHRELLNDRKFMALTPADRGNLLLVWLLAAEYDGSIPDDPTEVAWRLRMPSIDLSPLIAAGFLLVDDVVDSRPEWASRYIPEKVRASVLAKTDGKCAACGSEESIEIDHIVPVSRGGTGAPENLQALCISCNRSKRARMANHPEPCVAVATQIHESLRSSPPETEERQSTETEGEAKTEPPSSATASEGGRGGSSAKPNEHDPTPKPRPPRSTKLARSELENSTEIQKLTGHYVASFNRTFNRRLATSPDLARRIASRLHDGYAPWQILAIPLLVDANLVDAKFRHDLQPSWLLRDGKHPVTMGDGTTAGATDWISRELGRIDHTHITQRHAKIAGDLGVLDQLIEQGVKVLEDM